MGHDIYFRLWEEFWPKPVPSQVQEGEPLSTQTTHPEPPALARYIKSMTPEDWLLKFTKIHAAASDESKSDEGAVGETQPNTPQHEELDEIAEKSIRYLDLTPNLQSILKPLDASLYSLKPDGPDAIHPAFIIREDYIRFYQHALRCIERQGRGTFVLTGQPGIGKTYSSHYLVLLLLALREPFFLIRDHNNFHYFSDAGVQRCSIDDMDDHFETLTSSWVIIDVDDAWASRWTPPPIFAHHQCLVWTSSPRQYRQTFMQNQFRAELWFMRPWSTLEIVAATWVIPFADKTASNNPSHLRKMDPAAVAARYEFVGPIAGQLFQDREPTPPPLDAAIASFLNGDFFPSELFDGSIQPSHPLFMIAPQRIYNAEGKFELDRRHCRVEILCADVARRLVNEVHDSLDSEKLQHMLVITFNHSQMRSLVANLFKDLLRHALAQDR